MTKVAKRSAASILCLLCLLSMTSQAAAQVPALPRAEQQSHENAIVTAATEVLQEIMTVPVTSIPRALLADAQGIAIVPGMLKGGFVIGVRHGRGVVVSRDEAGAWQLPTFITLTGGSVGWQAGVQATDLVLVFKTKKSVQGLLNGKFTIGGDASAAAGPVGRDASVATDATLKAEIYSYSRSRGLFAGVALDGSALQVDATANGNYYRPAAIGQVPPGAAAGPGYTVPAAATRLVEVIASYATPPTTEPGAAGGKPQLAPDRAPPELIAAQQQLAAASQQLGGLLDDRWRGYLALPAEVYGQQVAPPEALNAAMARFQTTAANPQYAALVQRPEFQRTMQQLQQLISMHARPTLVLPPPPQ